MIQFTKKYKFQEGGEMPQEQAPAEQAPAQGGPEMLQESIAMMQQAVEAGDGEMALQACQSFLENLAAAQGAQGGQGAAPQEAPAAFKRGGQMVKSYKKKPAMKKYGGSMTKPMSKSMKAKDLLK